MKLLDTTLRDGSYAVNFKFDYEQTKKISQELDRSGVHFIECGHGVGIGASRAGYGTAALSDEVYMEAVASSVHNAKWGMFLIPGIGKLDDIQTCSNFKMDFLRLGVSIDDYQKVYPYIDKAKSLGLITCVNFMKSYTRSEKSFEAASRCTIAQGADYIYLVDSAGNMTPKTVQRYCERISDLPFGFHAHNNLGLANANSLIASENGASLIDASLQGLGRSTGNAMTEQLVYLLQRAGDWKDINALRILDIGDKYIKSLFTQCGTSSLDIISGHCGFHSSYMNIVLSLSEEYCVDPRLVIERLCRITKSEAPEMLLREICAKLSLNGSKLEHDQHSMFNSYFGSEQDSL